MPIEYIYENDSLNTGRKKINDAIDASDRADRNASEAVTVANDKGDKAVETAERAEQKSDSTQQQLDNIVIESGTSDAEVIQARGEYDVLNTRLNNQDYKINKTIKRIKTSEIGLSNNKTPEVNFNLLTSYISDDIYIEVDGYYTIKPTNTYEISSNFNMYGITKNAGFEVIGGVTYFTTYTNNISISIDNVNFNNDRQEISFLFHFDFSNVKIDKFYIENCLFDGWFRLLDYHGKLDTIPNIKEYGINDIKINYNKSISTKSSFIMLYDVPFNKLECIGNEVHDWHFVWLNVVVSNHHTYPELAKKEQRNVYITNNIGVASEGFWLRYSENAWYYCFALTECVNLYYHDNHIEGMKSDYNIATYEVYASAVNVNSSGNTHINNVNFHPDRKRQLMKAKSVDGRKVFTNNQIRVDENFITSNGGDPTQINFILYDIEGVLGDYKTSWEIRANYIDVPHLILQESRRNIESIKIEKNRIKSKTINGVFCASRLNDSVVSFSGNIINAGSGSNFYIVSGVGDNRTEYNDIVIRNNDFYNLSGYITNAYAKNFSVNSNKIKNDETLVSYTIDSSFLNVNTDGDVLNVKNSFRLFSNTSFTGDLIFSSKVKSDSFKSYDVLFNLNYLLNPNYPLYRNEIYNIKSEVFKDGQVHLSSTYFEVYDQSNDRFISFISAGGVKQDISIYNTVDFNIYLKINNNAMPFKLEFIKTSDKCYIATRPDDVYSNNLIGDIFIGKSNY